MSIMRRYEIWRRKIYYKKDKEFKTIAHEFVWRINMKRNGFRVKRIKK